jgi:hypothetical protein
VGDSPIAYDIDLADGNILINVVDKWLFIDTGNITTIGHTDTFEFGGRVFPCVPQFNGFTTEGLAELIGHPVDYLVGLEVLRHFPFKINLGRKEITFYPEGYEFRDGYVVPTRIGTNGLLPLIRFPFKFNGQPIEGYFDTGCPNSFMDGRVEGIPCGTAGDSWLPYGRWTMQMYRNQVEFGNRKFEAPFGNIPRDCPLFYVGSWLCGGEFLKSGPIGFDIARMRLHLFSNDNGRDGSESRTSANPPTGGEQQDPAQITLARPDKGEN